MEKYIVILKDKGNVKDFTSYLTKNKIVMDFKEEEALIFIVSTDENGANSITSLSYVKEVVKDKSFKVNIEKPNEVSPLEIQVDYTNWGVNRVLAPSMWRRGITGRGINVAVLDTGIGPHRDLNVSGNVSFTEEPPRDGHGHGTHVAGIIAGRNFQNNSLGVAYDANLYNVKILESDGLGTTTWFIQGIIWCGNNNIQVANMSLSYNELPDLETRRMVEEAINFSRSRGCIFVAASGNEGVAPVEYPASADGVISVGAININNIKASFSNYGQGLDYVAPGVNIVSTILNNGYAAASGTSMATPHVTAMVALLLSEDPSRTQEQIERILTNAALDLGNPGYDIEYGNGLIRSTRFPMTLIADILVKDKISVDDNESLKVQVKDEFDKAISDMAVQLSIVSPSNEVKEFTLITNEDGEADINIVVVNTPCKGRGSKNTTYFAKVYGEYKISARISQDSSDEDIETKGKFEVERQHHKK